MLLESLEPASPHKSGPGAEQRVTPAMPDLLAANPFLLPAQLLALNPQLYAAQLAQLQAAQLLQQQIKQQGELGTGDRKRSRDEAAVGAGRGAEEGGTGSGAKQLRPGSPTSPGPLDLSGPAKSPDSKAELGPFNPLLPPNLLSLFSAARQSGGGAESVAGGFSSLLAGFPSRPVSPPASRYGWAGPGAGQSSSPGSRVEDVFRCVWCKESYHTLEALTTHMKEAKHSPQYPALPAGPLRHPPTSSPLRSPLPSPASPASPKSHSRDILKEQLPLPRKLVRGQDVWIGRADQQTRDILKCMGCGASFRSLDLLTKHMQETQHYKKVISHDQISAWKYTDTPQSAGGANKNPVNSVLTCKVCDKGFSSLKELSDHMVRHNHYNGTDRPARAAPAPQSQSSRDRKKALPVKKLLELERARQEVAGNTAPISAKEIMESGKLLCERCEEKIPIDIFIPHIQQCVGRPRFLQAAAGSPASPPSAPATPGKAEQTGQPVEAGSSSILGSLEQLVKGNFTAPASSAAARPLPPSSSPLPAQASASPMGKFSISTLFPGRSPPPSPARPEPAPALTGSPGSAESPAGSPGSPASPTRSPAPQPKSEPVASNGNALAALQSFCNDSGGGTGGGAGRAGPRESPASSSSSPMSDPGAILAFSWACNQANNGGTDSAIKCPFCDTPFISKGAYRHHLSKMHFTKENLASITTPIIPPANGSSTATSTARTPSPEAKDAEESLQSKYQKYSQLAKQLSCYDGTN